MKYTPRMSQESEGALPGENEFMARMQEHSHKASIPAFKAQEVLSRDVLGTLDRAEGLGELLQAQEDWAVIHTDLQGIRALVAYGAPFETMVEIWNIKDEVARRSKEEARELRANEGLSSDEDSR